MSSLAFFAAAVIAATSLPVSPCASPCSDGVSLAQVQKRTAVADPKYGKQIELARKAALEIYDHGFLGNSGSAISQQIGRPAGMTIAVAVDGKVVWSEGFGFADLEQCVPASSATRFRIGSISKPLTATAAALLSEEKRLDLDTPIQAYVPSFPNKSFTISVRQLLSHLGGIPRDVPAENDKANDHPYHSVTESLKWFKDEPLVAPPGTKFFYSTYGYVLASAAIEGASGQNFLAFMHSRVFEPLGMTSTVADENDKIVPDRARWYVQASDGSYRNAPYLDLSYKWAGGGFLSTAADLARFGSSLLQPGFLNQRTLKMIFSSQQTTSGTNTNYGLGWEIHEPGDGSPERRYEHTGGVSGSGGILVIYPDQKVVVAWLMNSNDFRDWQVRNVAVPFFRPVP